MIYGTGYCNFDDLKADNPLVIYKDGKRMVLFREGDHTTEYITGKRGRLEYLAVYSGPEQDRWLTFGYVNCEVLYDKGDHDFAEKRRNEIEAELNKKNRNLFSFLKRILVRFKN